MKQLNSILAVLCLAASTHAIAGGDTGLYIGAGIGQYNNTIDKNEINSIGASDDFESSATAGKLIAGLNIGIIPMLDLAVEGNYVMLNQNKKDGVEVDGSSVNAFGLAGINLGPVGIFGKVGYANWNLNAEANGKEKLSGSDPVYGIGARFQLFGIAVRGEYEYYDIKDVSLDTLSASLVYTF